MRRALRFVSLCASLLVVGGLVTGCTPFALPPTSAPTVLVSPTEQPNTPVTPQTPTPYPYPPTAAGTPSLPANPRVEIDASATTLQVGDVVTVTSQVVSIRFPRFELYLGNRPIVLAVHNGEVEVSSRQGENTNPVLEFVSAAATADQARFVLRARDAGTVQARIFATGEMHYSGQITWASLWSDLLPITVIK